MYPACDDRIYPLPAGWRHDSLLLMTSDDDGRGELWRLLTDLVRGEAHPSDINRFYAAAADASRRGSARAAKMIEAEGDRMRERYQPED